MAPEHSLRGGGALVVFLDGVPARSWLGAHPARALVLPRTGVLCALEEGGELVLDNSPDSLVQHNHLAAQLLVIGGLLLYIRQFGRVVLHEGIPGATVQKVVLEVVALG